MSYTLEKTNLGTCLKIALELTCGGLKGSEFPFTARFFTHSNKYVDISSEDMILDGDNLIACVDTGLLAEGEIRIRVTADIPDNDFLGATRREIATIRTGIYLKG